MFVFYYFSFSFVIGPKAHYQFNPVCRSNSAHLLSFNFSPISRPAFSPREPKPAAQPPGPTSTGPHTYTLTRSWPPSRLVPSTLGFPPAWTPFPMQVQPSSLHGQAFLQQVRVIRELVTPTCMAPNHVVVAPC